MAKEAKKASLAIGGGVKNSIFASIVIQTQ